MNLFKKINRKIIDKAKDENYPYFIYALFQTISNPIYYLLWYYFDNHTYDSFTVRSVINLLCVPLLFHKFWPTKLLRFLPYYWHVTILYSLPFFFTFMLLKNNFSYEWSLNSLTGFVLCIIFIDISSLLLLLPIGVGLGILLYDLSTIQPFYPLDRIQPVLITYSSIIIFGKLFVTRNSLAQKIKQQSLKMQAAAIAHEMRTPLAAINHLTKSLGKILPALINTQRLTQEKNQDIPFVSNKKLQHLEFVPTGLEELTRSAFTVIDMLLMNLQENLPETAIKKDFISNFIKNSLQGYPLTKQEKQLISVTISQDFEIKASPDLLKHVLFNLLKNALHYLKAAGKGNITIWAEQGKSYNKLHFKDTGKGIPKNILPYIFDQFYSRTDHGTGVGLAFCKSVMQNLGGEITCESVEGEFTHFTLTFPVLES